MRIVMLGGTGYLGSRLVQKLASNGHNVLCITRFPQKYVGNKEAEYCDLMCMEQRIKCYKPEIFISAVGKYLKGEITEHEVMEANFEVPAKVLHLCIMSGVNRAITIGTSLPDNFNIYTLSKKLFADLGQWYASQKRLEFINVKLEMFYGIGEPEERFIPWMIRKMVQDEEIPLTEGTQKRDLVYIEDVVNAVCSLIEINLPEYFANIPLGSGEAPCIREVAEYLHYLTKSQSRLLFGQVPMRINEPDTVADKKEMEKWGIYIKHHWKTGMELLVRHALQNKYKG